jgi:hypothetical protein
MDLYHLGVCLVLTTREGPTLVFRHGDDIVGIPLYTDVETLHLEEADEYEALKALGVDRLEDLLSELGQGTTVELKIEDGEETDNDNRTHTLWERLTDDVQSGPDVHSSDTDV